MNKFKLLDPVKVGVAITDMMTGMYTASALMAALAYREKFKGFSFNKKK